MDVLFPSLGTSRRIRAVRLRRWSKAVGYFQVGWDCFAVCDKRPPGFIHSCLEKLAGHLPNSLSVVWAWRGYRRSNRWVGRCRLIHVPLRPGGIVRKGRQRVAASLARTQVIPRFGLFGARRPATAAKPLPPTVIQTMTIMVDCRTLSGSRHDRGSGYIVPLACIQTHT